MQRSVAFLAVLMGCFMVALAINDDTSILFVRGPLPKTQKISETSFADLLSHTLGLEPINPDQKRHNFPHVDLFDLPRTNLFVSVDGVGSGSNFFPNAYKVNVNRNNVVQDSLGYLVTLLTGATVAEHEIFGHSWSVDNQVVEAFSGPAAEPKAISVSDRLFEASKDSLVVCLSFDKQMAEALAAHRPSASRVFFYSESAQAFVDERNPSSVLLTKQQILEFALSLDDSTLPFPVVAELAAIRLLPTLLASLPRASTPVYVAVAISSTRQITASSPQLLSSVLPLFQAELTTVDQSLGERSAMQVALLGSSVAQHTVETPIAFNSRASREAKEDSTTTYTNAEVNSYQIMLWTALVLALSIIAASWVTCTLDTGTNTILHRLPMPKRNHDM